MNKIEMLGTFEECLKNYQGLIKTFCKKYFNMAKSNGLEWEDVYQECCIALYRAYESFDPERESEHVDRVSFGTLANLIIRRDVTWRILRSNTGVNVSIRAKELKMKINKYGLENSSVKEIAEKTGENVKFIEQVLDTLDTWTPVSIENKVDEDKANDFHNVIQYIEDKDSEISIKNAISKLTKLERTVLEYKLLGYKHCEIGEFLGKKTNAITTNFRRVKHKLQKELEIC